VANSPTAPNSSEKLDTLKSADPNSTIFEPFYGENGRQLASCIFQDSEVIKKLQGTCPSL